MKENEDTSRKPQSLQKKCWCGRVYYGDRCKEGHEPSVTEAELARVAELTDIRKNPCKSAEERQEARVALAVLTPRLARELAAARAAIKVAREWIEDAPHSPLCSYKPPLWRTELEDAACVCECDCGRAGALAQLNTHTHE